MILFAPAQCSSAVLSVTVISSSMALDLGIQPSSGIFRPSPHAAINSASALPWSFLRLHSARKPVVHTCLESKIQPSCGIFKPKPQAVISTASALPWSFLRLHSASKPFDATCQEAIWYHKPGKIKSSPHAASSRPSPRQQSAAPLPCHGPSCACTPPGCHLVPHAWRLCYEACRF